MTFSTVLQNLIIFSYSTSYFISQNWKTYRRFYKLTTSIRYGRAKASKKDPGPGLISIDLKFQSRKIEFHHRMGFLSVVQCGNLKPDLAARLRNIVDQMTRKQFEENIISPFREIKS